MVSWDRLTMAWATLVPTKVLPLQWKGEEERSKQQGEGKARLFGGGEGQQQLGTRTEIRVHMKETNNKEWKGE